MNETKILRNDTANGGNSASRKTYLDASVKETLARPEVQEALKKCIPKPGEVIIKSLKNPFKDKETGVTTQKAEAVSGTSLIDMVNVPFTLVGTELDPVASINRTYRIADYAFALNANMSGGTFQGYAAKGFKLLVTKLEEVKGDGQK